MGGVKLAAGECPPTQRVLLRTVRVVSQKLRSHPRTQQAERTRLAELAGETRLPVAEGPRPAAVRRAKRAGEVSRAMAARESPTLRRTTRHPSGRVRMPRRNERKGVSCLCLVGASGIGLVWRRRRKRPSLTHVAERGRGA